MWAAVSASVIGTSHANTGLPCQDSSHLLRVRWGDSEVLLAAVADGAGSASHSQIGSAESVQQLLKLVSLDEPKLEEITLEQVRGWFALVLGHLATVAEREKVSLGDLACTLLLGVVWKNGAVFGQIGDGAWVLEKDGGLMAATWPETGEFANVTVFLTTQGALEHLQFQRITGQIDAVAGFTDGIQSLTLDYAQKVPMGRFFNAMFGSLRTTKDETELIAPLQQMLASELITSRTDDDKTLLLAVWREPELVAQPTIQSESKPEPATPEVVIIPNGTAQ